jgi:predicted MPP superfamily phosphohydrolase
MPCEALRRRLGVAFRRTSLVAVAAGAVATAYMTFEAQWLRRRRRSLTIPGLDPAFEGLTLLHLSDVHAGQPGLNLRTLRKAVEWGVAVEPDVVVLTGDIMGGGRGRRQCLELLSLLHPRMGAYAVTGNHEHGLSKNPMAHRPGGLDWSAAGVTMLEDRCVALDPHADRRTTPGRPEEGIATGPRVILCGADHLTGGYEFSGETPRPGDLDVLLIHRPPGPTDQLSERFTLVFAGHTHGGQIRLPGPGGKVALHRERSPYVEGVYTWGKGLLAISPGIGTTFLPFRLLTRPEVILYRLTASTSD